jgi:hypothetical protein
MGMIWRAFKRLWNHDKTHKGGLGRGWSREPGTQEILQEILWTVPDG